MDATRHRGVALELLVVLSSAHKFAKPINIDADIIRKQMQYTFSQSNDFESGMKNVVMFSIKTLERVDPTAI